jgi:hypothetical protein
VGAFAYRSAHLFRPLGEEVLVVAVAVVVLGDATLKLALHRREAELVELLRDAAVVGNALGRKKEKCGIKVVQIGALHSPVAEFDRCRYGVGSRKRRKKRKSFEKGQTNKLQTCYVAAARAAEFILLLTSVLSSTFSSFSTLSSPFAGSWNLTLF